MANISDIAVAIKSEFPDAVVEEVLDETKMPHVVIEAGAINDVCRFLHDNKELAFDFLSAISGVDKGDQLEVVYIIHSYPNKHAFALKARVPRSDPKLPSVADVWKAADWHERETFDLFGIVFENHPDLRRLLMPDDWEGYPLRKDYKYPKEYDGIELRRDDEGWPDPGDKELYE